MKNNIISCPTPKQLESDDILTVQEDAQKYFDEEIVPILKLALHKPTPLNTPLRYGAYVVETLKSKGWQLRWDDNVRGDVIERKQFKIKAIKLPRITRPYLLILAVPFFVVWVRCLNLSLMADFWTFPILLVGIITLILHVLLSLAFTD